jgi:hypothetical protein
MAWTFKLVMSGLIAYVPRDAAWTRVRVVLPNTRNPMLNRHRPAIHIATNKTVKDASIIAYPSEKGEIKDNGVKTIWTIFDRDIDINSPSGAALTPSPLGTTITPGVPTTEQHGATHPKEDLIWLKKVADVNSEAKNIRRDCLVGAVSPFVAARMVLERGNLIVSSHALSDPNGDGPAWQFVRSEDVRVPAGTPPTVNPHACAVQLTYTVTVASGRLVLRGRPFDGGTPIGLIVEDPGSGKTVEADLKHLPKGTERVQYAGDLEIDEDFLIYYLLSERGSPGFHGVPTRLVEDDLSKGRRTDCLSAAFDPSADA